MVFFAHHFSENITLEQVSFDVKRDDTRAGISTQKTLFVELTRIIVDELS